MPFLGVSGDPASQAFADSLTEIVLDRLAQERDLRVAARSSTARYRAKPDTAMAIGQQLGVGAVLEGSVRHEPGRASA